MPYDIYFLVQLAMPFSVISNGEKIIDMKRRPGTLPVLDGLRFISTTWVVLGHTLQMMFYGLGITEQQLLVLFV